MAEMHNHFREAGLQILHRVDIKISPFIHVNDGTGNYHGIHDDVFWGKQEKKLAEIAGKSGRQERQIVFMSEFDKDSEKFRCGEQHTHVSIKMRRMNSVSNGALDLGTNLALGFLWFQITSSGKSLRP